MVLELEHINLIDKMIIYILKVYIKHTMNIKNNPVCENSYLTKYVFKFIFYYK